MESNNFNFTNWPICDEDEVNSLKEVLASGFWAGSRAKYIKEVRKNMLDMQHGEYGFAVANGTVSLESALKALDIRFGDEVIVPALTFFSTVSAVIRMNADPVIIDVDKDNFCMDLDELEKAITPKTKAVIVVHLAGAMCDMDRLMSIAAKNDIAVIEDCAHAHGSEWRGKGAGTFGEFGSFSFQHSKLISSGEGGFVIAKTQELEDKAWNYVNCGRESRTSVYEHSIVGTNNRMSDFQAAVLNAQILRYKNGQQAVREANYEYLTNELSSIKGIKIQKYSENMTRKAFYNYIILIDPEVYGSEKCAYIFKKINEVGVPTGLPYPPLTDLSIFDNYKNKKEISYLNVTLKEVKNARYISQNSIWLHHRVLLSERSEVEKFVAYFKELLNE